MDEELKISEGVRYLASHLKQFEFEFLKDGVIDLEELSQTLQTYYNDMLKF